MFAIIPLTVFPLLVSNLLVHGVIDLFGANPLSFEVWAFELPSAKTFTLTLGDALVCFAMLGALVAVARSIRPFLTNAMSIGVFSIYFAEFTYAPVASTYFFQLMTISLFIAVVSYAQMVIGIAHTSKLEPRYRLVRDD